LFSMTRRLFALLTPCLAKRRHLLTRLFALPSPCVAKRRVASFCSLRCMEAKTVASFCYLNPRLFATCGVWRRKQWRLFATCGVWRRKQDVDVWGVLQCAPAPPPPHPPPRPAGFAAQRCAMLPARDGYMWYRGPECLGQAQDEAEVPLNWRRSGKASTSLGIALHCTWLVCLQNDP
jgi:hypothetical protein